MTTRLRVVRSVNENNYWARGPNDSELVQQLEWRITRALLIHFIGILHTRVFNFAVFAYT